MSARGIRNVWRWTVALSLVGLSGCLLSGLDWFDWKPVAACQAAIRGRVVSEFGSTSIITFPEAAAETPIEDEHVRVTGRATVAHGTETTTLGYACEAFPRRARIVSATYDRVE